MAKKFIAFFCRQVILATYNGRNVASASLEMKLFLVILMLILISELTCYSVLHRHLDDHNNAMLRSLVITRETYKQRKSIHAMSMMSQHICFAAEFLHLALITLIRLLGRRFFDIDGLELFVSTFKSTEFFFLSTVQVFSSLEFRNEFLFLLFNK